MPEPLDSGLQLLADRWCLWLIVTLDAELGLRFSDLAPCPGLSRRVLAERLRLLERHGIVRTRLYEERPRRHRYLLTERGARVKFLCHTAGEVVAGTVPPAGEHRASERPRAPYLDQHPTDALLEREPAVARTAFEHSVLPLVEYDDRYRTTLVDTLEAYLACNASVSLTAERLYAHRHTVRYRLDRVRELTGLDVDTVEGRERLLLGLRARRTLAASAR